ncbi:unnamed protein product [Parajaminaea phylloscopi]
MAPSGGHSGHHDASNVGTLTLLRLPSDILLEILYNLSPTDASALAQTSRDAAAIVGSLISLWHYHYTRAWDPPGRRAGDGDDTPHLEAARQALKVRVKARSNLRWGIADQRHLLRNHAATLQTLHQVMRERRPRDKEHRHCNSNQPQSTSAATLASMFPDNRIGDQRWSAFVYPRQILASSSEWKRAVDELRTQMDCLAKAEKKTAAAAAAAAATARRKQSEAASTAHTKRKRDSSKKTVAAETSSSPHGPAAPESTSDLDSQPAPESSSSVPETSSAAQSAQDTQTPHGRRRSKRLQMASIPAELKHAIQEETSTSSARHQAGQLGLPDFDDCPLDESTAAHLHVLHGIRHMDVRDPIRPAVPSDDVIRRQRSKKWRGQKPNTHGGGIDRGDLLADLMYGYESQDGEDMSPGDIDVTHALRKTSPAPPGVEVLAGPWLAESDDDDDDDDDWESPDEAASSADAPSSPAANASQDGEGVSEPAAAAAAAAAAEPHSSSRPPRSRLQLGSCEGNKGDLRLRVKARAIVYDAGRFSRENAFGPLKAFRSCTPTQRAQRSGLQPFFDRESDREIDNSDSGSSADSDTEVAAAANTHGQTVSSQEAQSSDGAMEADDANADVTADGANTDAEDADSDIHHVLPSEGPGVSVNIDPAAPTPPPPVFATTTAEEGPASDADPDHLEAGSDTSSGPDWSEDDWSDEWREHVQGPRGLTRMVAELTAYTGIHVRNAVDAARRGEEAQRAQARKHGGPRRPEINATKSSARAPVQWRRAPAVDWITVESIMIVMDSNVRDGIEAGSWGSGIYFPVGARGDSPGDSQTGAAARQMRLTLPRCGWHLSRGQEEAKERPVSEGAVAGTQSEQGRSDDLASGTLRDWANVEGATWAGTYAFLDYPLLLRYNSALAHRICQDRLPPTSEARGGHSSALYESAASSSSDPSDLVQELEVLGDTLSLRLTLKDTHRQTARDEEGEKEAEAFGPSDPEFPTLRFEGQTVVHVNVREWIEARRQQQRAMDAQGGAPQGQATHPPPSYRRLFPPTVPRGRAHGFVRPIYSDDPSLQRERFHEPTKTYLPAIAGIYWRIVHNSEGADRWSLSGVQAGPPGTRAPIYGTWTDATHQMGSPLGPFAYYQIDARPWKEFSDKAEAELLSMFGP